jgi:hypothetical protein
MRLRQVGYFEAAAEQSQAPLQAPQSHVSQSHVSQSHVSQSHVSQSQDGPHEQAGVQEQELAGAASAGVSIMFVCIDQLVSGLDRCYGRWIAQS